MVFKKKIKGQNLIQNYTKTHQIALSKKKFSGAPKPPYPGLNIYVASRHTNFQI